MVIYYFVRRRDYFLRVRFFFVLILSCFRRVVVKPYAITQNNVINRHRIAFRSFLVKIPRVKIRRSLAPFRRAHIIITAIAYPHTPQSITPPSRTKDEKSIEKTVKRVWVR